MVHSDKIMLNHGATLGTCVLQVHTVEEGPGLCSTVLPRQEKALESPGLHSKQRLQEPLCHQ